MSPSCCCAHRYNMNEAEKTAFRRFYALRYWERDGGFAGDVTADDIQVGR